MAVDAPIPIMSVMAAVAVKTGVRRNERTACRMDWKKAITAFSSEGRASYAERIDAVSVMERAGLARTGVAADNVFSDGAALELATVTGSVAAGLGATLTVAV